MTADEKYMREAIKQAKKAYAIGEVPIGCVIVYQDKIIARGYNRRTIDKNTLAHAELQAIRKASKKMEDWRLEECTMYVTLVPDVLRRNRSISNDKSCSWLHEPKGRMRRIYIKSIADAAVQSSGRAYNRGSGRRMQSDDENIF